MVEGHNASRIRQRNLQAIVGSLRSAGTSSRAALAERLGLSRPTLTYALRELIAAQLVVELDERQTVNPTGRRRAVVALNGSAAHVLSVDIGGTKTALALHDLHGKIRAEQVVPTPTGSVAALLRTVRDVHGQLARQSGLGAEPIALAVGVPGVVRPDGRIDNVPNLPILRGAPLGEVLTKAFGADLPSENVTVENDVNLAAVGERLRGVARDLDHFAYLALGTGLGAGVFCNGRLLRGAQGYAGELGEWRFQRAEPNSLESEISGEALRLSAAQRGWQGTTFEIVAAALRGEQAALEAVLDLLDRLAHAVAQLHTLLDLQAVVLGGGLGAALLSGWPGELKAALRRHHPRPPALLASALNEHAILHGGAAWAVTRAWDHLAAVRLATPRSAPTPTSRPIPPAFSSTPGGPV